MLTPLAGIALLGPATGAAGASTQVPAGSAIEQFSGAAEGKDSASEAAEARTYLMFAPDPASSSDSSTIGAEELADELAAPLGHEAACEGELLLEAGQTQQCESVPGAGSEEQVPWTAHAAQVPPEEGAASDARIGALFTTGPALSEEALAVLGGDMPLTGVGLGTAFGLEDLTAEQLGEHTLDVLTSEHAYVPVNDALPDGDSWTGVSCESGMSFGDFEPIACTATTGQGASWQLQVLPGEFAENEPGLLVAIDSEAISAPAMQTR